MARCISSNTKLRSSVVCRFTSKSVKPGQHYVPQSHILTRGYLRSSDFMLPAWMDKIAGSALDSMDEEELAASHASREAATPAVQAAAAPHTEELFTEQELEEDMYRHSVVPQTEDALDIAANHFSSAFMCGGLSLLF